MNDSHGALQQRYRNLRALGPDKNQMVLQLKSKTLMAQSAPKANGRRLPWLLLSILKYWRKTAFHGNVFYLY